MRTTVSTSLPASIYLSHSVCARSTIETMERETEGRRLGDDEVEEMQRAVTAWQAQATEAQQVHDFPLFRPRSPSSWLLLPSWVVA